MTFALHAQVVQHTVGAEPYNRHDHAQERMKKGRVPCLSSCAPATHD